MPTTAVANTGAWGFITALTQPTPADLAAEIAQKVPTWRGHTKRNRNRNDKSAIAGKLTTRLAPP